MLFASYYIIAAIEKNLELPRLCQSYTPADLGFDYTVWIMDVIMIRFLLNEG